MNTFEDVLTQQQKSLWDLCVPLLMRGRSDDLDHAKQTVLFIMEYKGVIDIDRDTLIPTAMMHDIGHSAILPEHHTFISGPSKIKNGKLVHLLAGAKIAKDLLEQVGYSSEIIEEIVDVITVSDFDQLDIEAWRDKYSTNNMKIFHDIDALDRYTELRLKNVSSRYGNREQVKVVLEELLDNFFFDEFKSLAKERLEKL